MKLCQVLPVEVVQSAALTAEEKESRAAVTLCTPAQRRAVLCRGRGLDPRDWAQVKQRGCLVCLVKPPQSCGYPGRHGCVCITVLFRAMSELLNQISGLPPLSVPCSAFQSSLGERVLDDSTWADTFQQFTQCTAAPRGTQDTGFFPPSLLPSLSWVLQGWDVGPQHQIFLPYRFTPIDLLYWLMWI